MRDTARYVQFFLVLWCCLAAGLGWQELTRLITKRPVRIGLLVLALLVPAWSSMELHRTTFRHKPNPPREAEASFYSIELLGSPSAGEVERRLLTWYAPQSGIAVHYRPEDMPRGPQAALRPRWEVPVTGPWRQSTEWRGEAWIGEGTGQVRSIRPGPDRLDLEINLEGPGLLVVNQNFHRDWRIAAPAPGQVESADGLLALRFDSAFKGPVRLEFRSRSMTLGAVVSLLTLLSLLAIAWRVRRTSDPSTAPHSEDH